MLSGLAAYVLFAHQPQPLQPIPSTPTPQPPLEAATTTSTLLKYTNNKYGYELESPQGAQYSIIGVSPEDPSAIRFQLEKAVGFNPAPCESCLKPVSLFFYITSRIVDRSSSLQEWVDGQAHAIHGPTLVSEKDFKVAGESAYWTEFTGTGASYGTGQYNWVAVDFRHNGIQYEITGVRIPENPDPNQAELLQQRESASMPYVRQYERIFDAMLRSFRFTN